MDLNRFSKYIQGGQLTVNGKIKKYKACPTDISMPKKSEPYIIDRKFYFAKESKTWNRHGVGFISNKKNKKSKTFSKLYLISEVQFSHLFAQENGRETAKIDFDKLTKLGIIDYDYNFYNRIVQLDKNYKGFPILTFTNRVNLTTNKPHPEYVRLISSGLKLTHKLTSKEAVNYLSKKGSGAKKKELIKVIQL
ncbi:MAG: hypothetical protein RH948_13970 [Cyclobacteriaceae bacterium]